MHMDTLHMPWSFRTVSTTAPDRAIFAASSLDVALQTGQSGASEVQNRAYSWQQFGSLSPVTWYCFDRGWPRAGDGPQNTEKDIYKILGISELKSY